MGIRIIVFDFDGTLIDSNRLKADAYFKLFPPDEDYACIIREVLAEIFEESRHVILEEILRRMGIRKQSLRKEKVGILAEQYNRIVLDGAKRCLAKAGVEEMLKKLSPAYALYVSSTTPQDSLREIIGFRNWDGYFRAVFGYPHKKSETLRRVIDEENVRSDEVIVVGDGKSDRESAEANGCLFVQAGDSFPLARLDRMLANP